MLDIIDEPESADRTSKSQWSFQDFRSNGVQDTAGGEHEAEAIANTSSQNGLARCEHGT